MVVVFVLGFVLNFAQAARVIPPKEEFCGSIQKVVNFVTSCEKNKDMALLGLKCAVRLQFESKKVSEKLAESFLAGSDSQTKNFSDHDKNIGAAINALSKLERKNSVATRDILNYLMNLVHPDELYELPPGVDTGAYLRNASCFGPNRKRLLVALYEMEKNKEGIENSKKILKDLAGKSNIEIAKLLQVNFSSEIQPFQISTSVKVPEGIKPQKKGRGKSDISGTKEENQ